MLPGIQDICASLIICCVGFTLSTDSELKPVRVYCISISFRWRYWVSEGRWSVPKPPYLRTMQQQSFLAHILKEFLEALSIKQALILWA